MPINLGEFLGKEITATLRDGSRITGKVEVNPSKVYCSGYPFFLAGFGYMGDGYYEGSQESPKDIVSIREPSSCVNLRDYLDQSVLVTYRDGKQGTGVIRVTDSHNYPFRLSSGIIPEYRDELTYTECGQVLMFNERDEDIVSIQPCTSRKEMKNNLNPNEAEKSSAVEKMALALLPAVFTSLESDPNLDEALEKAIRGTFLAMFGADVTGETLNRSVSVIKSRISLSVKQ